MIVTTIFCLVSRQTMANVLPVLMYKPKRVVLFTTPEEKRSADNLEMLFTLKDIQVIRVDGMDAYDYFGFKNIVRKELNKSNEEVWLNITGGTKLMALAAYEIFTQKNKKIIYCDTEHQNVITLLPEYNVEKLQADISVDDYLLSYGYKIKETKDRIYAEKFFPLFDYILKNNLMQEFVSFFRDIREIQIENRSKITLESKGKNFVIFKNFDKYTIQYNPKNKYKIVIDRSEFKLGDWLEFYVYYNLKCKYGLNPLIGIKIISQENVENEIDVLVMKDYKLTVFSCKTGKSDNQFDLFQLETLRNIVTGTFGRGIFITSNKPTSKFLERAKELQIKVVCILNNQENFI